MECVITANHHNKGKGIESVPRGQMAVVNPAQGLAYSYSINTHVWKQRSVFCKNMLGYLNMQYVTYVL